MSLQIFSSQSKPSSAKGKKGHDGEVIEEDDTSTSDQQQSEKQLEDPSQQSDAQPHEQTVSASVLAESCLEIINYESIVNRDGYFLLALGEYIFQKGARALRECSLFCLLHYSLVSFLFQFLLLIQMWFLLCLFLFFSQN